MRDAEDTIERVLAGLREAAAPPGMEERILRAMEDRATLREDGRLWNWMMKPAFALAGVGLTVVLLVVAVSSMRRPVGPVSSHGVAAVNSREVDRADGVPQRLKPLVGQGGYGTAKAVPSSGPGRSGNTGESLPGDEKIQVADATEILPMDQEALAVSEMLAPSKPAPPLPLTHQEKLLAQVVHQGQPEELATLRPEVRAKQMEISKAEYKDFFEPPPVKDNE